MSMTTFYYDHYVTNIDDNMNIAILTNSLSIYYFNR